MRRAFAIVLDAFYRFLEDDGWAIASYIALTTLMALFPFLILVTALAAFLGSKDLADNAANLLLDTWPKEVAEPIAGEVHRVLSTTRGDVLTLSGISSVYFASSGVESLRIGLNRAYGVKETRNWLLLRIESIIYVLVGAIGLLALTIPIVLGPFLFATALRYAPWVAPLGPIFTFVRFAVATGLITVALFVSHKWLPAGHRKLREVAVGILVTLVLWLPDVWIWLRGESAQGVAVLALMHLAIAVVTYNCLVRVASVRPAAVERGRRSARAATSGVGDA